MTLKKTTLGAAVTAALLCSCSTEPQRGCIRTGEELLYHEILTDCDGNILPWFSDDPATAYNDVIERLWHFWYDIKPDLNGLPYYMNHLAWYDGEGFIDRGIGGDQIQMMLSSFELLYRYTGNERIRENMQFMADYYLSHSLSPSDCKWPYLPFPQNTMIYSGIYDGDMILGPGFTQPDKAGSFGFELLKMYKMTPRKLQRSIYLDNAVKIADVLAAKVKPGDEDHSPWPFKVNVFTGETGKSTYTTNYAPTLELMEGLCELGTGDTTAYRKTIDIVTAWMNEYPIKRNKWGPFFEDVAGWSDTQINAVTWAQYLMKHKETDAGWQVKVRNILDWVYDELGDNKWEKYGVIVVDEQTAYRIPGNSHTARQACTELQYYKETGDSSRYEMAVRQLNWATYMVSNEGMNRYPSDAIWFTDGYGDYIRHYLRAMEACPELCPPEAHILGSKAGVKEVTITPSSVEYHLRTSSTETIRLPDKPVSIVFEWDDQYRKAKEGEDWEWKQMDKGGLAIVHADRACRTIVKF